MATKNLGTLQAGQTVTITGKYKAKESDMGKTDLVNTVTAKSGNLTASASSAAATMEAVRYDLDATKTQSNTPANGTAFADGETVAWDIKITNTGNQTLNELAIKENLSGATLPDGAVVTVSPKSSSTKRAQYTIKNDDLFRDDMRNSVDISNNKIAKSNVYSPYIKIDVGKPRTLYVYVYDEDTLYFTHKKTADHGDHILNAEYTIYAETEFSSTLYVPWYKDYNNKINKIISDNILAPYSLSNYFSSCRYISDLSELAKWDTRYVENMDYLFSSLTMKSLKGLEKWDVSSVKSMIVLFYNEIYLDDLSAISEWKTSNVTNMRSMFSGCKLLESVEPLANWDVSHVESMRQMFNYLSKVNTFEPLNGWNVSSVTDHDYMFGGTTGTLPTWGVNWRE